jgi:hypothetical protein
METSELLVWILPPTMARSDEGREGLVGSGVPWLRNAIVLALMAPLFPACLYATGMAFQFVGMKDAGILGLVLASIPFGILGAILFGGTPNQRGALVFLAAAIAGVGYEIFTPDPRHPGAQLFVTIPFGLVPTVVALVYAHRRAQTRRPEDGPSAKSGPTP